MHNFSEISLDSKKEIINLLTTVRDEHFAIRRER